ncbi:MAG: choice-of-anchor Q domain-containing protein [Saprospiraceae bacterium]
MPDCIVDGVDGCSDGMLYEQYPMFIDTLNHDFRLLECSPAINVGNNDFVDAENTLDLNQQMRILDGIVDMGAYEQPALDIEINYSLQNAATVNTFDGFISIDSTSGSNMPYSFLWSNGDTTTFIGNLSPGDYFLTITAINGCENICF